MGGAKMIILNSPANPTGGVLRRDTLLAVLDCARRYDTLIVSDEVYDQFLYDGSHVSMASLPGARERTITVNSFSKSHAMAGARIGYVTANEHLMRPMMMSQFVTTPFVPVRSQELALRALAEPRAKWRAVTDDYRSRRQLALDILHAAGLECPVPGGAFYIWLPVGSCGVSGRQFAERLLDEHGVLTMPGDDFGPSGQSYVRISYAVPRDELIEGLQRVVQLVADLRAESATSRPSTGWWRWLRGRAGSGGRVLQGPHAAQAARASGAAAPVQEGTVC
jgi:aminotransferase